MMISKWILTLTITAVCLQTSPIQGDNSAPKDKPYDILIIAHLTEKENSISVDYLRGLFLAKKKEWPSGGKVVAVNAKGDSQLRQVFRDRLLGMSNMEEERYWEDRKVKYGTSTLPEFSDTQRAVFHLRNSISYVFRKDYHANTAKVVAVLRE